MIDHIEGHPHALVKEGLVVWVGVFESHDQNELFDTIQNMYDGEQFVCCCLVGYLPSPGWLWDGSEFIDPDTP